ncbi:VOC family protein [Rhizomonospora bruguierae]|uniref:VOC family protein n=1 Tax=Rhizomonospora bruguierae TaxID=1581705 RepID=UPI001BCEC0E3|nr:VOC family protein [Micromonospora sp. NBRC 107566]
MANGRGRQVPARRAAIAVPVGAAGVFVAVFGLGLRSWQVAALGLAFVVIALGLVFVPALRGGSRVYVSGTGHVVAVSEPPASSVYGRCEMQLVVEAPGLPPAAVRVLDSQVPIAKWPDPGATLPILVAVDDLRRVRVQWDDVLTHAELADYLAQEVVGMDTPPGGRAEQGDPEERHGAAARARAGADTVLLSAEGEPVIPATHPAEQPPGGAVPRPHRPSPSPRPQSDGQPAAPAGATAAVHAEPEAPAVLGVGITLLVQDLEQSVAFYRETLGFHQLDTGDGNTVLASGETRLVLRAVPEAEPVSRRVSHINLEVADVQVMYEALREKGVRFTYSPRVVNRGERLELWAAAFRDPDGHGIALAQWHQPPRRDSAPAEQPESPPKPESTSGEAADDAAPAPAEEQAQRATGRGEAPPPRGPITKRLNPEERAQAQSDGA